jgi:hypothetical protein
MVSGESGWRGDEGAIQRRHRHGGAAQELFSVNGMLWFSGVVKRDPAIDVWLNEQAPELGGIAQGWFVRMRESGDDVRELMHDGCPVACVGDAPFGYVNVFRAHVNVGFFFGAELEDPTRLLEGSGRRMRHVKVKPGGDLNFAALSALIDAAYADIKSRLQAE